jgi:hypothetical protein
MRYLLIPIGIIRIIIISPVVAYWKINVSLRFELSVENSNKLFESFQKIQRAN